MSVRSAIELRPAGSADEDFLAHVYGTTRERELEQIPFTAAEQAAFLAQQFAAQSAHYATCYARASFDVLLVDGEPAGRLIVDRRDDEILIVDIALLPSARGAGIGTRVLGGLLEEGAVTGRRVSAHVARSNPARRLYARLGFSEVADDGVYVQIERIPPTERNDR